ncbi:DUF1048 domain-containing protein [Schumannella luteola]
MAKNIIELLVGSLDEKKRWRAYKARTKQLPEPYKTVIDGIERYLMYSGDGPMGGERLLAMYDDLADLFERAAVDGTPVREIVGDDPSEFVTAFAQAYTDGGWIAKERRRLERTIAAASGEPVETDEPEEEK